MMRQLKPNARRQETAAFNTYFVDLATIPEPISFDDLFQPLFWAEHTKRLHPGDQIRVRAADGSYDCMLSVHAVMEGGVAVELWPSNWKPVAAGQARTMKELNHA